MTENKIKCECGKIILTSNLKRHQGTDKHKTNLEDKTKEKITHYICDCGSQYTHKNKKRHEHSSKHIEYLKHNKQYKINGKIIKLIDLANKSHEEIYELLNK